MRRDRVLLGRVLAEARAYRPHIAGIFLLNLLATPLLLLSPIPLKIAVDTVLGSHPLPGFLDALLPGFATSSSLRLLAVAASLQVLLVLLNQLQELGSYVLTTQTGERLTLGFRARLFRHVQRLSLSFHDARGTTDSLYRIQYDAPAIQYITVEGLIPFVSAGVMLVAMFCVTALLDWQLALVALAVSPLLFLYSRTYNKRMRPRYMHVKGLESQALKVVQEVLTAFRVVKAFGREDNEQERFVRHSSEGMRARIRLAVAEGAFGLLVNLTTAVGTALVLFIGIRNVQSGVLTVGELLIVLSYLAQLYGPLTSISQQIASLQSSLASAERAFELLGELPEVPERPNARPLARAAGMIELRDVSFAYDGKNPVLEGISLSIEPGMRLGIAGATGAGKTTLVSLLTRFYDPTSGQILLDGVDLRDYRLADLRNQFAIVLQEPVLFSTSLAENIAYARPDAGFDEIVAAAEAANAHDFVVSLPDGYETLVGERGMRLSGGERQRIALARAFLKDAPILVLDEPTSSVDLRTEALIMDAMERLVASRTTLLIAHRLSALDFCDARIEVEHGRIARAVGDCSASVTSR